MKPSVLPPLPPSNIILFKTPCYGNSLEFELIYKMTNAVNINEAKINKFISLNLKELLKYQCTAPSLAWYFTCMVLPIFRWLYIVFDISSIFR